jgi:anthranilate/para-aminobenzoate synthase component I
MAEVVMNPIFMEYKGHIGEVVIYRVGKKTYSRRYVKPRNPNSEAQQAQRSLFAEAMEEWKKLSAEEQQVYKKKTRNTSLHPHNLFVKKYTAIHKQKRKVKQGIPAGEAQPVVLSEPADVQSDIKDSTELRNRSEATPYAVRRAFDTASLQLLSSSG